MHKSPRSASRTWIALLLGPTVPGLKFNQRPGIIWYIMLQNQGFEEVSRNGAVPSRKRPWSEVTPNWELTKKIGKTNRYWYKERQWAMWLKFGMDKHKQRKINAYYSGNFREHDEINIVIIGHQWCARSDRRLESYSWPSAPWRPAGLRPHSRASSKKQVLLGNILPNSGHLYVYMSICLLCSIFLLWL